MKKIIFFAVAIFFCNISFGQEIEMKMNLLGYRFVQNGEKLSLNEVVKATESHKEANELIKKARSQRNISNILSFGGGALIGIPLGQLVTDQDPNWTLAYIGGGIGIIAIPFSLSSFNNLNKGVDTYNLSLRSSNRYQFNPEFEIAGNFNGLGLRMKL